MKTLIIAFALSVFVVGVAIGNGNQFLGLHQKMTRSENNSEGVLSESDDAKTSENKKGNDTGETEETFSETGPSPSVRPFPTLVTLAPAKPTSVPVSDLISKFIYPGSSVASETQTNLSLISWDDPKAISDWYKAKVKELNFTATSSVFTQTNDKYLIKISASSGMLNIMIEVTKEGNENAKINVSLN